MFALYHTVRLGNNSVAAVSVKVERGAVLDLTAYIRVNGFFPTILCYNS